jgi:FkbH-like protein
MDQEQLSWLPKAPIDFRKRSQELQNSSETTIDELRILASYQLDESKLTSLGRCIMSLQSKDNVMLHSDRLKLGVVSNASTNLLALPLIGCAARYGISLEVVVSDFGQFVQQALDPESDINQSNPDVVLVSLDYRAFFNDFENTVSSPETGVDKAVALLLQIAEGFNKNCGAVVMLSTLAQPPGALFGSFDLRQAGTLRWTISEINRKLVAQTARGDVILDVASLAESVGTRWWFDCIHWNHGKLPFSLHLVPLYVDYVCRVLAAIRGKSRKCLVVDLDNTLWGGVIGDDGIEGIIIGNGSAEGEAFLDFQRFILKLRDRGIILAVCSKNDESVALSAFRLHSEMLLKEEHFSAFICNWKDKPNNIRHIAQKLNIGLDALVFFDDNPFERELVRKELPEVAVIEVPKDPSLYRGVLSQSGWFEAVAFSEEDSQRIEQYRANEKRDILLKTTDVETYLRSLSMSLQVESFNSINRSRVTQLINKTNQFNLTTRRYTEHQVESFETSLTNFTACYRLVDSYGDNGIISCIICTEPTNGVWEIDTWLMSCRVFNRRVEHAILNHLVECAKSRGICQIIGVYVPSGKNQLVADHYKYLGFMPVEGTINTWHLDIEAYITIEVPISILNKKNILF